MTNDFLVNEHFRLRMKTETPSGEREIRWATRAKVHL